MVHSSSYSNILTLFFFFSTGVFMYGVSGKGYVLSDYVIVSNIVATILVVAVTIQVNNMRGKICLLFKKKKTAQLQNGLFIDIRLGRG